MKYAVYRANDCNLRSVHLKLGQPRTFFCDGRMVMLIQLTDANSDEIIVLQPKKIFHRGPVRNAESGDLSFQFQSSFDADFANEITRLQSEVEDQVIEYLSNDSTSIQIPIEYRLLAREAKQSRERLKVLHDEPIEKNFSSRCEEYAIADRRSHIFKPCFKECKMWLKAVADFRIFDDDNQIIENGEKQLVHGDYDFGVRLGDAYIGPHGDTGYIASLQCRVVQVRYHARSDNGSEKMSLNTCMLMSSPSVVEVSVKRKKAKRCEEMDERV